MEFTARKTFARQVEKVAKTAIREGILAYGAYYLGAVVIGGAPGLAVGSFLYGYSKLVRNIA